MRVAVLGTLGRLALFAGWHSLLASHAAKRRLVRRDTDTDGSAAYRVGYVAASALATGWLGWALWRLPDRELHRFRGRVRVALAVGQLAGVAGVGTVALHVGPATFSGLVSPASARSGRPGTGPTVAQHPLPGPDDELRWGGPFRLCRHPNNFFPLLVLGCRPTVTAKWSTVALGTAVYMVLGSLHEEARLRTAYGPRFERYRSEVPRLLLPLGHWSTRRAVTAVYDRRRGARQG